MEESDRLQKVASFCRRHRLLTDKGVVLRFVKIFTFGVAVSVAIIVVITFERKEARDALLWLLWLWLLWRLGVRCTEGEAVVFIILVLRTEAVVYHHSRRLRGTCVYSCRFCCCCRW